MKGSEFIQQLPNVAGDEREAMLLQAVKDHNIVAQFVPLVVVSGSVEAHYLVSSDVVRFGDASDSVRLGCGQRTHQLIADELGCVLPTFKLSDEIYRQADLKLNPTPHKNWVDDQTMGNTNRMVEQSRLIDKQIGGKSYQLVAGHHKDWVNTAWFGTVMGNGPYVMTCPKDGNGVPNPKGGYGGCNYGWHFSGSSHPSQTLPGVSVWQGPGHCHNMEHADYSQYIRLVSRIVLVCAPSAISGLGAEDGDSCTLSDGSPGVFKKWDIYDMPSREALKPLVTHEGGGILMRHPMVPWAGGGPTPLPLVPSDIGTGPAPSDWFVKLAAFLGGAAVGWYGLRWLESLARRGAFDR